MGKPSRPAEEASSEQASEPASPLSLNRLREAFAAMLSPQGARLAPPQEEGAAAVTASASSVADIGASDASCEISPRSVVEAMLFVGRPDNRPFTARELAATMRGVSPAEIDSAVVELNAMYERDGAPYAITGSSQGYLLELRPECGRMRDKLNGRMREAKLSPAALESLSIVAYKQPTTADEVSQLRGAPSGSALATLVRRRLVRLERSPNRGESPHYWTTDRFLRLFGLENLAALPQSEEIDKS